MLKLTVLYHTVILVALNKIASFVTSTTMLSKFLWSRKNPKHFQEFAHPSLKSPVSDDDEDPGKKLDSPPSGGRQKRAAALKQKGVKMLHRLLNFFVHS